MQKATIRQQLFAWIYKKSDKFNDQIYGERKRVLFRELKGTVVEIGPGTGINFRYYPRQIKWIGLEPNGAFHEKLLLRAREYVTHPVLVNSKAEEIALPDESADFIISTLVLCSVSNPERVLIEIRRVLKTGGKLIFIEHTAADEERHPTKRRLQNLYNPINQIVADGCHCNRETWKSLHQAGFHQVHIEHHDMPGVLPLMSPHIFGFAVK